MKRLILVFLLVSSMTALGAQTSGIFEYEESAYGAVLVSCTPDDDIVTIPEEIDSMRVVRIGESFIDTGSVREVRIPSSVLSIASGAFSEASGLEAITVSPDNPIYASLHGVLYNKESRAIVCYPQAIAEDTFVVPDGVWQIDNQAFKGTENLRTVVLPDGVKEIGRQAFEESGISEINLPDGLCAIGYGAFFNCDSLESLSIPASVFAIGDEAFVSHSLESISVDPGNESFCSIDGVLFDKGRSTLIAYPASRQLSGAYSVPGSVRSIGKCAFCYARLDRIRLPEDLDTIGNDAFWGAWIDDINLPDSISSIGEGIFDRCLYLEDIYVNEGSYAYDAISRSEWARYLVFEPSWLVVYPSFPTLDTVWEEYWGMPTATENGPSYTSDELLSELVMLEDIIYGDELYSFHRYVFHESLYDPDSYYMAYDGTLGMKGGGGLSVVLCGFAPGNGRTYWGTIDGTTGLVDIAVMDEEGVSRILAYLDGSMELLYMSINGGASLI